MNKYMYFLILCLFPMMLRANLAENKPMEQIQPDGTKLSLFVSGDEYNHRVHDANGYTILLHPETGYAVYAFQDGNTIKASNFIVGQTDPSTLGIQPNLLKHDAEAETRFQNQLQHSNSGQRVSPLGVVNNIVVFVRFHDQTEFPTTPGYYTYDDLFNSTGQKSLADYYDEVSQGQLAVNSYLYGNSTGYIASIQLSHNRNYYSPYNATTNPGGYSGNAEKNSRNWGMFGELCTLTDPLVPNNINLDTDGDNINDALTFVIRGGTDGWSDILWPQHLWWTGSNGTINGVPIWHYVTDFEGGLGSSVICHEMGHMIGFPDLYHYNNNFISPVGSWSLMASDNTQHELAYEKWKYGTWFTTIPTITPTSTPTQYTLTAIDQSPYSCYKIPSNIVGQFYMLEYRRQSGRYEVGVPATGLIAYRVIDTYNGNDIGGNAAGPPDEIYVYRPGGDITSDGVWPDANMSSTVGRTGINNYTDPKPWMYVYPATQMDGNLVITDVGPSGGTTITFTVRDAAPNIWDGSSSTNWNTPANWSQNTVPTMYQYVEIPSTGITRWPIISSPASCKSLIIKAGANCLIGSSYLSVYGDLSVYGNLTMYSESGYLSVDGSIYWESGSSTAISANGLIYLRGNMEFKAGSSVSMATGTIEFNGVGDSWIRVYATAIICNLRSYKTAPGSLGISYGSTNDLVINGDLYNYNGKTFHNYLTGILHIKGNFSNASGGIFTADYGTISFEGNYSQTITNNSADGCYFNNLRIAKTSGAQMTMNTSIAVKGDLNIQSGSLSSNTFTIDLGGNWIDLAGTVGFIEGTGQVIFSGTGQQSCSGETFYTLILNKPSGELVIPSATTTGCARFDWVAGGYRVDGGTFNVSDMVDAGIFGNITLNSGNINYTQDTAAGAYVDLQGNITIHGGAFTINGGVGPCDFPFTTPSSITMDGGTLDFSGVAIRVRTEWALAENITGGTIRTRFGFENQRSDFTPSGGTIELYGSVDCSIVTIAGSNFYNLTINKSSRDNEEPKSINVISKDRHREILTRTNSVSCPNNLDINGAFSLLGGTFTAPAVMQVAGNWINNAGPDAFIEGTGTVEFNGASHQYCDNNENFYTLLINKTAAFRVNYAFANVTCVYYTWTAGAVDILNGTFTANDLTQNGVYGNFYTNPGGVINLHQGSDQYIDLNGFLYNYGGTINIYGGSIPSDIAWSANAGITMTSGTIDFKDKSFDFHNTGYTLTVNVTGGVLRGNGGCLGERANVCFNGGYVDLCGPGYYQVSLGTGSYFYNLSINKTGARPNDLSRNPVEHDIDSSKGRQEPIDYRFNAIYAGTNLMMHGSFFVTAGIFEVSGRTIEAYNSFGIWGNITMTIAGSILYCGNDFYWSSGSTTNVTTGSIVCLGGMYFTSGSAAQLNGCTTYMSSDYDNVIKTSSPNSWFGNLSISGGGGGEGCIYSITSDSSDSLVVKGILAVAAENTLDLFSRPCRVDGNTSIVATGGITVGDGGYILMKSALDLSGVLNVGPGTAIVKGIYTSYDTASLLINWGVFINDIAWARDDNRSTVELKGAIHLEGGQLEITNNTVVMRAHADRIFNNCLIRVGAGFTANELNAFHQESGEVELIGNSNPTVDVSNGNYICSLIVNKGSSYRAYLQNDLIVKGDMGIQSGGIITNNRNMTIGGTWTNNIGPGAFTPGTGTVTFNKVGSTQLVLGQTNFYNVIESHTGTLLEFRNTTTVANILNVNNGVSFYAIAATIGTMNNTVAAAEVRFTGNYTSTIASYNGGGIFKALSLANVIITDIVNNGIFGQYLADNGAIELHQGTDQWTDINGQVTIANNGRIDIYGGSLDCYITYGGNAALTMTGGELNFKSKGVIISNNAYTFNCNITSGIIRSAGGFSNNRTNFTPSGGRIELTGATDGAITMAAGSYFYDLYVSKASGRNEVISSDYETNKDGSIREITRSNTIILGSAIDVRHNVQITAGTLNSQNNNITVYGYWQNLMGTAGFTEGTGTVTFTGSNDNTGISNSDTFYNLIVNNTSASWNNFEIPNGVIADVAHDLTVTDGTVNMLTGSALNVTNDISIASGAGINCQNSSLVNISVGRNWTDANAAYTDATGYYPGTSTLTFSGSLVQTVTHASANLEVFNLVINKVVGAEVHFNKPVRVLGNCSITSGVWVDMITNLTHEFRGNLVIGINGTWYASNRNTIAFKGSADQVFTNNGSSSIYSLTVDKPGAREERANTVSLGSNILGLNSGNVLINAGILDLNNYFYRTTGSVTINNTGKIAVDGDGSLELGNTQVLTVNSGGTLELIGTSGHNARLTHQAGNYALNIESGGTISAEYATFEYMNTSGINVKNGAFINTTHALNNCTFQLGAATGTLITINNNQTLTISGANFPTNIWSGSYNVTKSLNQGTVNFSGYSGNFSGTTYESDTNGRINWLMGLPDLRITAYYSDYSSRYVCEPVSYSITIINDSDYAISTPIRLDLYYNTASIPLQGTTGDKTYSLAGLGAHASTTYTFPASSSTVAGYWQTYYRLDTNNTISESNESNNAAGFLRTTWNSLPAVQSPSISYIPSTNRIQLNWTYPTSVNQYKIYRSTNSAGPFTTLAGTSSTTTFSEEVPGLSYFYKVVAEKNWP